MIMFQKGSTENHTLTTEASSYWPLAPSQKTQTFNHKGHEGTQRKASETYANLG